MNFSKKTHHAASDLIMEVNEFGKIFDESLNEIYLFDAHSYKFVRVNRGAQKNLGYTMEELSSMTPVDIKPAFSLSDFTQLVAPLTEGTKQKIQFETIHQRKDGRTYPVEVHLQLSLFGEQSVFIAIILDITERRQAREERDRFFSLSLDLLCVAGLDGYFKRTNPAFELVLGYTSDELQSAPFMDFVHPDDISATLAEMQKLGSGIKTLSFENRYRCKDGSYRYFLWTAVPILEEEMLYAIARDITERKMAEEVIIRLNKALEHQVAERTLALDHKNKANSLLEALGRIQSQFLIDEEPRNSFNELLVCLLDITDSEYGFIGEVLYDSMQAPYLKTHAITNIAWNEETEVFYQKNAPKGMLFKNLKTLFGKVMTTGKAVVANDPKNDSRSGGCPHGHPPLNHFLGLPLHYNKRLVGMIGIANRPKGYDQEIIDYLKPFNSTCSSLIEAFRSNEKRKKAEKEIIKFNQTLEERVKERTEKLEQSNKKLKQFAQIAGHDLRSPVSSIIALFELLDHDKLTDPDTALIVSKIEESAENLGNTLEHLINSITEDKSRIEAIKEIRFKELLAHIKHSIDDKIKEAHATITADFTGAQTVSYPPSTIYSILLNLMTNAIKYRSTERPLTIDIKTEIRGTVTCLYIRDNGIGIDLEKNKHKLFKKHERFHQKVEGKGLGLYLVKEQLEELGGKIEVESEVNVGTTFKVCFENI